MKEVITTTAVAGATGFLGWLFSKLQTRRERKKSDLQLISEAVSPLITAINDLTEQNKKMVNKLLSEQNKNLQLLKEKAKWTKEKNDLLEKVEKLEKTVHCLQEKINKLIKSNEK